MVETAVRFDVFLSYHWRDHEHVEAMARGLEERGLRVFLDRWYLVPGRPWPTELERILSSCSAVAVCLGPAGLGSWQLREQQLALDRQTREPTFSVIPLLLPGSEPPLGFLSLNTWVDLRDGLREPTLDVLAAVARGVALGPDQRAQIEKARTSLCPFRGLLPFREEDAEFFCGRDEVTQKLVTAVRSNTLVAVLGASGSGKSSVSRAGLVPALRSGQTDECWEIATLVPSDRPMRNLVHALVGLREPDLPWEERLAKVGKVTEQVSNDIITLRDLCVEVLAAQTGTTRLLLLVDQFEELYSLVSDDLNRTRFLDGLLDAIAHAPVTVVLTLRGDFYGRVLEYRPLADRLQGDAVVSLGPMNRDELKLAMILPAEKVGLQFEEGLAERILDDAGREPGNLPLLEFVLQRLWQERRGHVLLHSAYTAMRGLEGAIAQRAEEVFGELGDRQQDLARQVLLQLVRLGEDVSTTRQRAVLETQDAQRETVIRRLTDARLLVTARDETSGSETVEVAHEALLAHWPRMRDWVAESRDFLRIKARLEVLADQWKEEDRLEDRLLQSGTPVQEAVVLLQEHRDSLPAEVVNYIEASIQNESKRRRSLLLLRVVRAVVVVVFTTIIGGLVSMNLYLDRLGLTWAVPYVWLRVKLGIPPLPEMLEIPAGEFVMGDDSGGPNEKPSHTVVFKKRFAISKYEVTFNQYDAYLLSIGRSWDDLPGDSGWGRSWRPVIKVSWQDAKDYAEWLSQKTGNSYRLPTEAEWEYVARAGSKTQYWWGDDIEEGRANCYSCGSEWDKQRTAPVGSLAANEFGVHDTAGNVWEWVEDCWHQNHYNAPADGSSWLAANSGNCALRVIRGGSWGSDPRRLRSVYRSSEYPVTRDNLIGFRLAQDIE